MPIIKIKVNKNMNGYKQLISLFLTSVMSLSAYASLAVPVGIDWFSIVEIDGEQRKLQVGYLLLENETRDAYVELTGCSSAKPQVFQLKDKQRGYSSFDLNDCKVNDKLSLTLTYEKDGQKDTFKTYSHNSLYADELVESFKIGNNAYILGKGVGEGKKYSLHFKRKAKKNSLKPVSDIKLLFGNTFVVSESLPKQDLITGFVFNQKYYPF